MPGAKATTQAAEATISLLQQLLERGCRLEPRIWRIQFVEMTAVAAMEQIVSELADAPLVAAVRAVYAIADVLELVGGWEM